MLLRNEPNLVWTSAARPVAGFPQTPDLAARSTSAIWTHHFEVFDQRPRLAKKFAKSLALVEGRSRVKAGFKRVLVAARSARARCAPVHAAAPLPLRGRRPTGPA